MLTKAYLLAMYNLALLCWNIFFPYFFFAKKLSVHNTACIKKVSLFKLQLQFSELSQEHGCSTCNATYSLPKELIDQHHQKEKW